MKGLRLLALLALIFALGCAKQRYLPVMPVVSPLPVATQQDAIPTALDRALDALDWKALEAYKGKTVTIEVGACLANAETMALAKAKFLSRMVGVVGAKANLPKLRRTAAYTSVKFGDETSWNVQPNAQVLSTYEVFAPDAKTDARILLFLDSAGMDDVIAVAGKNTTRFIVGKIDLRLSILPTDGSNPLFLSASGSSDERVYFSGTAKKAEETLFFTTGFEPVILDNAQHVDKKEVLAAEQKTGFAAFFAWFGF